MTLKEAMLKVLDDAAAFPEGWNTGLREVFRKEGKDLYETRQRWVWEVLIETPLAEKKVRTIPCRSLEKAQDEMENDISRVVIAEAARFDPQDVVMPDERHAHIADEYRWSIVRRDLLA
ncbi:MAG: hypothetical protein K6F50_06250 [Kiritimatiellae bacterium]|nr:hypothetical protein [Kiritimatiellia bacterium]